MTYWNENPVAQGISNQFSKIREQKVTEKATWHGRPLVALKIGRQTHHGLERVIKR